MIDIDAAKTEPKKVDEAETSTSAADLLDQISEERMKLKKMRKE